MKCRFCKNKTFFPFVDLGHTAISNALLNSKQINESEKIYPLKVVVCDKCFLVQVEKEIDSKDIFTKDYVYFSSVSKTWLKHSEDYCNKMIDEYGINKDSFVLEIASNDGYLLQYFKKKKIPCAGVEPTLSTAKMSKNKGIKTFTGFFNSDFADNVSEFIQADLIVANNVLAHVPDINDFLKGIKRILKKDGIVTFEFPYLLELIDKIEFDTIYHEHYFYFTITALFNILIKNELKIFHIEKLNTHGGSLRVYIQHLSCNKRKSTNAFTDLLACEDRLNVKSKEFYKKFQKNVDKIKLDFLEYIIKRKQEGNSIIAFGAAAKGNTFLNYCGIKKDMIDFVIDETESKQYKYLPQSHIPIVPFDEYSLKKINPDIIIILPWNFKDEIIKKLRFLKNVKFTTCIPKIQEIRYE